MTNLEHHTLTTPPKLKKHQPSPCQLNQNKVHPKPTTGYLFGSRETVEVRTAICLIWLEVLISLEYQLYQMRDSYGTGKNNN